MQPVSLKSNKSRCSCWTANMTLWKYECMRECMNKQTKKQTIE